jgi:hypothetical protein
MYSTEHSLSPYRTASTVPKPYFFESLGGASPLCVQLQVIIISQTQLEYYLLFY